MMGIIAVVGVMGGLAFFIVYRPWQLTWGASRQEVARTMVGDEVARRPTFRATRAVTIDAPPEDVWPWIVQIGFGRSSNICGWFRGTPPRRLRDRCERSRPLRSPAPRRYSPIPERLEERRA